MKQVSISSGAASNFTSDWIEMRGPCRYEVYGAWGGTTSIDVEIRSYTGEVKPADHGEPVTETPVVAPGGLYPSIDQLLAEDPVSVGYVDCQSLDRYDVRFNLAGNDNNTDLLCVVTKR